MALFKFLFVLALAVPLGVLMSFYINKLLDEFKTNLKKGKSTGVYEKKQRTYNNVNSIQRPTERSAERSPAGGYSSARANFENSRMKQKYEESLRESNLDMNKNGSERMAKGNPGRMKSSENREKSKRRKRAGKKEKNREKQS